MLRLQVLDDAAQLTSQFCQEWSQLHSALPAATPFQTPEWLVTWWKHFGGERLQVLTFRDSSGQLSAVLPYFLHEWQGFSQLTLLGSGISDYLDPLILNPVESDVILHLSAYLREQQDWEVCNWQDLSSLTPLAHLHLSTEEKLQVEPDALCSAIPISRDFEAYWRGRSTGLKRNIRRYSQKAAGIAELRFEQIERYSEEHMEALLALHTARWREQGEPGMVRANRSGEFLRQVSRAMSGSKGILFFALRFQERIAAVILAFPHRGRLFAYLSAFDPAYNALGLGKILLHDALRFALEAGYRSWNFLRGQEPYKTDWGAVPIGKVRVIVQRASSLI